MEKMGEIVLRIVGDGYLVKGTYNYFSPRYKQSLTIQDGFYSDGATDVPDIDSDSWIWHDYICRFGVWDSGEKITNWQASNVLADILTNEARKYRERGNYLLCADRLMKAQLGRMGTFLFGGGAARKNGMWRIKDGKNK